MKLYGSLGSTCTRKVLMVFAEKKAEYELVPIDLSKGEHKQPAYCQHQPFGVIPVLEDDGFWLYESRAIMRYLDARLPGIELTPKNLQERALMEQWISVEQSYFSGPAIRILKQLLWNGNNESDKAIVVEAQKEIEHVFAALEIGLEAHYNLAGENFSLADLTYIPYIDFLFKARIIKDFTNYPKLQAWWERTFLRSTWRKISEQD